jgi:hypothetical protein
MSRLHWKERFGKDGICDFRANYEFYFKWLLSKTCSCFYLKNLPETMDEFYIISNLLIDGDVCITKFNNELYACIGAPGGQPDEYYRPSVYTIANPILGSKIVKDGVDGVIIYNTPLDAYVSGGLYGLISQTATLLADNIVSINCCQINSRVTAITTADSPAQRIEAEATLKSIYAGHPFKVVGSDIIDKINVNPIATTNTSQNLAELIELHNYIIANYFQSIGIKANDIRKKAHVLQDEIDSQNDYLQISILELLTSWQSGFDKVNELFGTDIHVELNPVLLDVIVGDDNDNNNNTMDNVTDNSSDTEQTVSEESVEDNVDTIDDSNNISTTDDSDNGINSIEDKTEQVENIVDLINDVNDDTVDNILDDQEVTDDETSDSEST